MKEIWNNEWFKLGSIVVVYFVTAVSPGWGATIVFPWIVAWMWNKYNS